MRQEILELDQRFGKEYRGKYVFSEISWAKRNRIITAYTTYNQLTGEVVKSDFVAIQAATIMASLHGQPDSHPITLEKLLSEEDGITNDLGETLVKIANRVCSLDKAETRFLSEQSDVKNPTMPSQNSDSAKNLAGHQDNLQSNQQEPSNNSL
jgi:hypothetical protein